MGLNKKENYRFRNQYWKDKNLVELKRIKRSGDFRHVEICSVFRNLQMSMGKLYGGSERGDLKRKTYSIAEWDYRDFRTPKWGVTCSTGLGLK